MSLQLLPFVWVSSEWVTKSGRNFCLCFRICFPHYHVCYACFGKKHDWHETPEESFGLSQECILTRGVLASLAINTNWKPKQWKKLASKGHGGLIWGRQSCKGSYMYGCKSVNWDAAPHCLKCCLVLLSSGVSMPSTLYAFLCLHLLLTDLYLSPSYISAWRWYFRVFYFFHVSFACP